ncbi:hypothetical protein OESDEN_05635, partial [Oesophagostomum dentatum]
LKNSVLCRRLYREDAYSEKIQTPKCSFLRYHLKVCWSTQLFSTPSQMTAFKHTRSLSRDHERRFDRLLSFFSNIYCYIFTVVLISLKDITDILFLVSVVRGIW